MLKEDPNKTLITAALKTLKEQEKLLAQHKLQLQRLEQAMQKIQRDVRALKNDSVKD
jgi:hypothetical protein